MNTQPFVARHAWTYRHCKLQMLKSEIAMSTLVEELSARARALSAEDRARLVEELLDSLQGEPDAEAEAEAAWEREIERRVAEIESGAVAPVASEDVHAEARRLIRG
ncbi:MAG: addiction module protein [Burkholderiaceae bacterium]